MNRALNDVPQGAPDTPDKFPTYCIECSQYFMLPPDSEEIWDEVEVEEGRFRNVRLIAFYSTCACGHMTTLET